MKTPLEDTLARTYDRLTKALREAVIAHKAEMADQLRALAALEKEAETPYQQLIAQFVSMCVSKGVEWDQPNALYALLAHMKQEAT